MLLSPSTFPSAGFGASAFSVVDITPLTYSEIIDYSACPNFEPDSIGMYKWDIEHLLSGVKGYGNISAFDLNFLISFRKMRSTVDKNTFTMGGRTFSVEDVFFTPVSAELKNIYKVDGKEFKFPDIGKVERTIMETPEKYWDKPVELAVIATALNESVEVLLASPVEMFATIEYLKTIVISQPTIKVEGGEEVVLRYKSSDLFQDILKSQGTAGIKIESSSDVSQ